jgi:hypothetical protein
MHTTPKPRRQDAGHPRVSPRDLSLLRLIGEHYAVTLPQLARLIGRSEHAARWLRARWQKAGWVGRPIGVSVGAVDSPVVAAVMRGTLRAGSELRAEAMHAAAGEAFYFYFAENAGTGFFLHAGEFRHAEWTGLESSVLAVIMGGATYAFEPHP